MIEDRRYTVAEIDQLRDACDDRYLWGTTYKDEIHRCRASRSYKETDKTKCVEELVRTYMLAGITAQDIYAEDEAKAKTNAENRERMRTAYSNG